MYLSTTRSSDVAAGRSTTRVAGRVAANVVALGAVSLVTDVSSEMITAVLPVYLTLGLGLSPFALGVVNGVYSGVTALVRLIGGQLADRTQRRKAVAGFGYALSAVCKLGLLAAGSSIGAIGTVIAIDRTGKGLRTAPRDALISLSSDPQDVGRAFGVHRAMDTVGALAGPLLAFVVLWRAPNRYDAVFVVSFCFAVAGLVILALFVRDRREALQDRAAVSLRAAVRLLADRSLRRLFLTATLFGLFTIGDAFVFLLLQRRLDVAIGYFPLLPLGSAAIYLLLAIPLGRLADRLADGPGRWLVFVAGNVVLAGVYLLLMSPVHGLALLVSVLAGHGAYYAATDGVLMAAITPHLPSALRTSGMALVQTGTATAGLLASVGFGAAWSIWGTSPALALAAAGVLVTTLVAATWTPRPGAVASTAGPPVAPPVAPTAAP